MTNIAEVKVHVNYKTFAITKLELKHTDDGSKVTTVTQTEFKLGAEVSDEDVTIKTDGYKEKKK